jgi:hypothetical protein
MTKNVTTAEANRVLNEIVVSQVIDLIRTQIGDLPDEKLAKIKVGKLMSFRARRNEPRVWFAVIEDVDMDAILVTFDCDGCVELHCDDLKYLHLDMNMLLHIYDLAETAKIKSATP